MTSTDNDEGAEHVTDFLRRIKELGEQRDQEDMERTRKLEEDILEARKQREARRKGEYLLDEAHLIDRTDQLV